MNVNRKVLFGAVALLVLLISFIQIYQMDLQTRVGAQAVTYACYFPSVVDNNNDKKAWIEIMNIAYPPPGSNKVTFYVEYIYPNETLVKRTSVSLSHDGRVRLRVWNQVGKPFDGQVFIYSSYEFVAEHTQWWKIEGDWEAWSVLQRSAAAPIPPPV